MLGHNVCNFCTSDFCVRSLHAVSHHCSYMKIHFPTCQATERIQCNVLV